MFLKEMVNTILKFFLMILGRLIKRSFKMKVNIENKKYNYAEN